MDYKRILQGVVNIINITKKSDIGFANICSYIGENCHELVESEDDRIRKDIVEAVELHKDFTQGRKERIYAWLEKQGEHANFRNKIQIGDKVTRNEDGVLVNLSQLNRIAKKDEKRDEQKLDNKVEPKFKVGDWVVQGYNILKIRCVGDKYYCFETVGGYVDDMLVSEMDSLYHLWTIEDAKDGGVLVNQNGEMPFIFKECKNNYIYCYCGYTNRKDIFFNKFVDSEGEELHWLNLYREQAYPATKEQRDLLFQKMNEAGYEWDAEKKELKRIKQKFNIGDEIKIANEEPLTITKIDEKGYWSEDLFICGFDDADKWKLVEQKPTDVRTTCYWHVENTEQNPAWSEEDEKILKGIIDDIQSRLEDYPIEQLAEIYFKEISWLKSLKERYTWKPSEGQLECLGYAIEKAEKDWSPLTNNRIYLTLKALKEQLLELMESKVWTAKKNTGKSLT